MHCSTFLLVLSSISCSFHAVVNVNRLYKQDHKINTILASFWTAHVVLKCLSCTLWHKQWLPGVQLRYFSIICAVHIEDCESRGGGCPVVAVADHCVHKPGVLGSLPNDSAFSLSSIFTWKHLNSLPGYIWKLTSFCSGCMQTWED